MSFSEEQINRYARHILLDGVGGEYLERNLDCRAVTGTIMQVGVMNPAPVTFPLAKMLGKRARLIGTVLRARPLEEKIALTRRFAAEMMPLFDTGRLRPVIDSRFALDAIADAHVHMEANKNVGKILIDIAS